MEAETKAVVMGLVVLLGSKARGKIPTPFGTITLSLSTLLTAVYLYT